MRDPDGNGVELYWDRPKKQWPRTPEGGLAMFAHALDLDALLPAVKPVLDDLARDAGFWLSDALRKRVLTTAGETS
jgi:catechol-2,3-dioxygenase